MAVLTITVNEALAAIAKAQTPTKKDQKHTYSASDICTALGIGRARFPEVMRPWLDQGKVRVVSVKKLGIDGRRMTVKAYQFVP